MKRILTILFLLASAATFGQKHVYFGPPNTIDSFNLTMWVRQFKMPTTPLISPFWDSAGSVYLNVPQETIYFHNGLVWQPIAGGGGGGGLQHPGPWLIQRGDTVDLDSAGRVAYTLAGATNLRLPTAKAVSDALADVAPLDTLPYYAKTTALADSMGVVRDSLAAIRGDIPVDYIDSARLADTASAIRGAIPSTSGFVPYTGAVDSVRLGEKQIRAGQVALDLTPTAPTVVGGMYWDATNVCPAMPFDATYTHRFGQAIVERARNNTGTTISAGKAVYISGAQGNNPTITMANPDSVNSSRVIGITVESIADNATGFVMVTGKLDGINTSGFTTGAALYLDTITGGLTQALLPPPHNVVYIGQSLNSTNNGRVFIRPAQALGSDTTLGNASQQIAPTQEAVKKYVTNNRTTVSAGTGISVTGSVPTYTITNTAPDQTVALNSGTGISVSGSYPTFTVTNTSPSSGGTVTSIQVVGGTGATVTPTTAVTTSGVYTVTPEVSSATYNTLTNKRITYRTGGAASYTTSVTIAADSVDMFVITAQAGALLFNAPSGTPTQGQILEIVIKDNGTARALTWNAIFDWSPPSTTVLGKWMKIFFQYNATSVKWNYMRKVDEP